MLSPRLQADFPTPRLILVAFGERDAVGPVLRCGHRVCFIAHCVSPIPVLGQNIVHTKCAEYILLAINGQRRSFRGHSILVLNQRTQRVFVQCESLLQGLQPAKRHHTSSAVVMCEDCCEALPHILVEGSRPREVKHSTVVVRVRNETGI